MRVMKARGSVRSFTSHGGWWPVVVPQAGAGAGSPSGTQNLLPSLGFVKVTNTSWIISFIFFPPLDLIIQLCCARSGGSCGPGAGVVAGLVMGPAKFHPREA